MSQKKCIFIGGKQIGVNCLRILLDHGITPKLVVPNSDDDRETRWHESLIKVAKEKNLPLISKKSLKDQRVIDRIRAIDPEIIFCIGSTQILPSEILKIAVLGCINIHPALLPKYRGRYSTVWAIFNGERETGVTLHWMDNGIDSGPIISQKKIAIKLDDTAKSLYDKCTKEGGKLFIKFLQDWIRGNKIPKKRQNEKRATFYKKNLPNDGEIDWNWDGKKICNFIRAMTFEPFPPPSFMLGKTKMVIVDEKYLKKENV